MLLKALLENWWTAVHADEENEMAGESLPSQARFGNEYFKVPGHTPLIFRSVFIAYIRTYYIFVNFLRQLNRKFNI